MSSPHQSHQPIVGAGVVVVHRTTDSVLVWRRPVVRVGGGGGTWAQRSSVSVLVGAISTPATTVVAPPMLLRKKPLMEHAEPRLRWVV